MRALIVDDSRFIRQHLRQLLEGMGVSCEEAADGQRGAAAVAQRGGVRLHAAGCEYAGDEWPGVREGAARGRAAGRR